MIVAVEERQTTLYVRDGERNGDARASPVSKSWCSLIDANPRVWTSLLKSSGMHSPLEVPRAWKQRRHPPRPPQNLYDPLAGKLWLALQGLEGSV
ncbi:hypothetical protein B0H19DRAFT_1271648 [Mycena capillaripes]|nr:hypothetical protein B0H19DRAFT_1271648 [Mycena capillaripes]